MNITPAKLLFYAFALLSAIALFFAACTPKNIAPNTSVGTSTVKNDSIAKADTLPSFNSPAGLTLDAAGNLYVADYGNNLIRKITPAGIVSTMAGSGTRGSLDQTGILASFNNPTGITIDASGNLYIADSGNDLIRKVTIGGVVTTIAGSDTTGYVDATGTNAAFFGPTGIAVDAAGNLYVADAGNNAIRKVTTAGVVSTFASNSVASTGSTGTLTAPSFNNPTGIVLDKTGNIYIANYLNNNILKVALRGTATVYAGSGQQGATDGPVGTATFYLPNSVAIDAANNIYVADGINNTIRKITPAGVVSTLAGSGVAGATNGMGTAASFNGPAGIAVDASGNVYVADSGNNLIRKVTATGVVTTLAGNGKPGAKNGKAVTGNPTITIINVSQNKLNLFYRAGR